MAHAVATSDKSKPNFCFFHFYNPTYRAVFRLFPTVYLVTDTRRVIVTATVVNP